MSIKTVPEQRQALYDAHQAGATYAALAIRWQVSVGCVRYWCRRLRTAERPRPLGRPRRGLLTQFAPRVRYVILRLRLEHPRWGPTRIRHKLTQRPSLVGLALPQAAQIGRYLHQWPRFRRRHKASGVPARRPQPPQRVHQRWQVDFKLGLPLTDGSQVNLTTVRDPVGEVCIAAQVSPAGPSGRPARRVTRPELQAALRAGMTRWQTLPEEVQTDHEAVCIGQAQLPFPSPFTLWLVGLGIQHVLIRPGTPTDNAEVERCHQTLTHYAITGVDATDATHLQQVLDQAVTELAYELPSRAQGCAGQAPVVAHPELLQAPRPFAPQHELACFDLGRVDAYLARWCWVRRVSARGEISLGGKYYVVGAAYRHQDVLVCFDPTDRHYLCFEAVPPYRLLRSRPARGLAVADLTGLASQAAEQQQLPLPLIWPEGVDY